MLKFESALKIAQKLEGITSKDHFGGIAFVHKKKIFATFWEKKNEVNVLLTPEEQEALAEESEAAKPVKGTWGRKGWTTIDLSEVDRKVFIWAIETAYARA